MNKVKLLIMQDDPLFVQALKEVIAGAGYRLRVTVSGAEALEAVAAEVFHLVVQDVELPHINGPDVLQEIASLQGGAIVMTGEGAMVGSSFYSFPVGKPLKEAVSEFEKRYIGKVIDHTGGRKSEAAKMLGLSRKVLWEKLKK